MFFYNARALSHNNAGTVLDKTAMSRLSYPLYFNFSYLVCNFLAKQCEQNYKMSRNQMTIGRKRKEYNDKQQGKNETVEISFRYSF
jgi:hypothetical protein